MKNKKNIDEIFQKGFENLDLSPSPHVWENIRAELEKKKSEKRVIPLWIRLGGVAAVLAIMLTVGNRVFNSFNTHQQDITEEQIEKTKEELQKQDGILPSIPSDEIVSTDNIDATVEKLDSSTQEPSSVTSSGKKKSYANSKIASTDKSLNDGKDDETQMVSEINADRLPEEKYKSEHPVNKSHLLNPEDKDQSAIAKEKVVKFTDEEEKKDVTDKRPSLLDAIAKQHAEETDSKESHTPENRWRITPNLAPVYYSSFGKGSSIDPEFANNPQKGDVNMSYGVQVSYAVNDKFSIRTGLNNVDLSYSTSDILIASGPVSRGLKAVEYGQQDVVITALNKNSIPEGMTNGSHGGLNLKNSLNDARLIQDLNYFEIPVELQYKLIDRKLGVNLIGGISTLLLGENEVSVKADNFSEVLGAANNLSNVSFATNFGIGLNYELSKRFSFNLEPTFKYQLNPYTDSSVDFKPYYLGVYSGLSIKF